MALKMDRQIDNTEIGYFLNEVAERGVVVSVSTAGSGVALDSNRSVATVAANSSGARPLGILLNDFVSIDRTRIPLNWQKDQQAVGDKCTILTKGWVVTNKLNGTPSGGMHATLGSSGFINAVANVNTIDPLINPRLGRFRTGLSEDGYARIYVDL